MDTNGDGHVLKTDIEIYDRILAITPVGEKAIRYLTTAKCLTERTLHYYQLGHMIEGPQDSDRLLETLLNDFTVEELRHSGVVTVTSSQVPILNWLDRAMLVPFIADGHAHYLLARRARNPSVDVTLPGRPVPIFNLYGLQRDVDPGWPVCVCEDVMDALACIADGCTAIAMTADDSLPPSLCKTLSGYLARYIVRPNRPTSYAWHDGMLLKCGLAGLRAIDSLKVPTDFYDVSEYLVHLRQYCSKLPGYFDATPRTTGLLSWASFGLPWSGDEAGLVELARLDYLHCSSEDDDHNDDDEADYAADYAADREDADLIANEGSPFHVDEDGELVEDEKKDLTIDDFEKLAKDDEEE